MTLLKTTDNNRGKRKVNGKEEECIIDDNMHFTNLCKIAELTDFSDSKILFFPQDWLLGIDKTSKIFELDYKRRLTTNNIMGFVGCNETRLSITSRFAKNDNKDFLLHYMLSKVLGINVVNLNLSKGEENMQDFLPYLFPSYLQNALSQGLYKQYKRNHYNDANVKGAIDINRHIKINILFAGKVAYTTREHSYDNPVTQLVRHTIEHLRMRGFGNVLTNNPDTRANVSQIEYATSTYKKNDLQKVIKANLKPVNHPYFTKYRDLQKLCLQILRKEGVSFEGNKDEIHGLLFDGAWLWEEYLNKVFIEHKLEFIHAENKTGKNAIYLLEKESKTDIYPRFPDFHKENHVLDAKYKRLKDKEGNVDRNDMHQIISYMHVLSAQKGGFVYPDDSEKTASSKIGRLKGHGGEIWLHGFRIPENNSFEGFSESMRAEELCLKGRIEASE